MNDTVETGLVNVNVTVSEAIVAVSVAACTRTSPGLAPSTLLEELNRVPMLKSPWASERLDWPPVVHGMDTPPVRFWATVTAVVRVQPVVVDVVAPVRVQFALGSAGVWVVNPCVALSQSSR